MNAVIEALAAAGVPSEQARNIAADWLLGPHEEIADAEDADRLMIATDAARILPVLLEARLAELADATGTVDIGVRHNPQASDLLDLIAPVVPDA